jgi:hypothetical protein
VCFATVEDRRGGEERGGERRGEERREEALIKKWAIEGYGNISTATVNGLGRN